MTEDLDTLLTALYVEIDDHVAPPRQGRGRRPRLADAELGVSGRGPGAAWVRLRAPLDPLWVWLFCSELRVRLQDRVVGSGRGGCGGVLAVGAIASTRRSRRWR